MVLSEVAGWPSAPAQAPSRSAATGNLPTIPSFSRSPAPQYLPQMSRTHREKGPTDSRQCSHDCQSADAIKTHNLYSSSIKRNSESTLDCCSVASEPCVSAHGRGASNAPAGKGSRGRFFGNLRFLAAVGKEGQTGWRASVYSVPSTCACRSSPGSPTRPARAEFFQRCRG